MQEDRVQSIYKAVSTSFDESNPYHQNFVRCLDFIIREGNADKAEANIPAEIKTMICEAVQEILKETEPDLDSKLNPDSEPKRTKFSQELENEWLPNLPKFMSVVPPPKPKPKPKPVPVIKVEHEKTSQPLSPKESAISPKQSGEMPSTCMAQSGEKRSTRMVQPNRGASTPVKKQPDRPASVPVKNKKKGFFSRSSRSKPQDEDTRKDQSKSL